MEDLEEDVEALLHYWEDGTQIPRHAFGGLAQACKEGRLDNENLPREEERP